MCVLRTEIARLNHAAAIAGAQQAAVIVTVTQESLVKQNVEFQWAFGALQPGEHKLYLAPAQAQEDARDEWEGIDSLPNCDDLIWLYCQDTNTTDGPVTPSPSYADSWTHWAYAEAPSTKAIDAARAAQGGAQ